MLNRHGWTTLVLGLLAGAAGRVFGLIELYVLSAAAILCVLWSLLAVRRPLPLLSVSRVSVPAVVPVGEPARVDLRVGNSGRRRSPHLQLWESVGSRGGAPMQLASLRVGESATAAYRVPTSRRGAIQVGPLRAEVGDQLGLCRRSLVLASRSEVLVVPRIVALTMPSSGSAGRLGQHLRSKSWGQSGGEFHALREYAAGDDPRSINWKASARSTGLIVRESTIEGLARVMIVLDDAATQYTEESWEHAVSAAASLVAAAQVSGLDVRLISGSLEVRGPDVVTRSLRQLATAAPSELGVQAMVAATGSDGLGLVVVVTGSATSSAAAHARSMATNDDVFVVVTCTEYPVGNGFCADGTSPESLQASWNMLAIGNE